MSIGKRLIIIFLSSFFGITMAPDILVGADSVEIKDVAYSFNYAEKKVDAITTVAASSVKTEAKPVVSTPKAAQNTPLKKRISRFRLSSVRVQRQLSLLL